MALHLFSHLEKLGSLLRGNPPPVILVDFDGTLAPIVPDPGDARMSPETREDLESLGRRPGAMVAVISGRSLEQLMVLVPVSGVIRVGNHGLEISGPDWRYRHPEASRFRPAIRRACEILDTVAARFPGSLVEDKGLTASLHFRNCHPGRAAELIRLARQALEESPDTGALRLESGRKVLEIRPPVDWHKGAACLWLLDRVSGSPEATVYMGDDRTDEDAFRALPRSITIRVGNVETSARYYVRDQNEAARVLTWLAESYEN